MNVFRREPAAIGAFLEALVPFLVAVTIVDWSPEQVGAVTAVITMCVGVYTAYVTHDTLLSAVISLVKAGLTLGVAFGLDLTQEQTATAIALLTAMLGLYQRTQTSPLEKGSFKTGIEPGDAATP